MQVEFIGDVHCERKWYRPKHMTPYSVQLGDLCLRPYSRNWVYPDLEEPRFFIDGNHECFPELNPDAKEITLLRDNLWHIPRGYVSGRVMFFGGAGSIDKDDRTPGHTWFPEESITQAQVNRALDYPGPVEVMATHTGPLTAVKHLAENGQFKDIILSTFSDEFALDVIRDHFRPKLWVFAHWHQPVDVQIGDCRFIALGIRQKIQLDVPVGAPWTTASR